MKQMADGSTQVNQEQFYETQQLLMNYYVNGNGQ